MDFNKATREYAEELFKNEPTYFGEEKMIDGYMKAVKELDVVQLIREHHVFHCDALKVRAENCEIKAKLEYAERLMLEIIEDPSTWKKRNGAGAQDSFSNLPIFVQKLRIFLDSDRKYYSVR